jgi:hypothetical protein
MTKSSKDQIIPLLTRLRVRYGPHKTDPRLWAATTIEYIDELCHYAPDVLEPAMRQAWKASPQFFPGLGLIVECCESILKSRVVPESHRLEESTPDLEANKKRIREIIDGLDTEIP